MRYEFDASLSASALADLRQAVGWNRMERDLADNRLCNTMTLCCFDGEKLIGYAAVVSNGITDAYIQDVMVHPDHQHQGIGRELIRLMLNRLRDDGIYMVSLIYGDKSLQEYYEAFGFTTMLCGQLELRPGRD